jgi:hypothetical protein
MPMETRTHACVGSAKVATARHVRSTPIQSLRCVCRVVFPSLLLPQKKSGLLKRRYERGQIFPMLLS